MTSHKTQILLSDSPPFQLGTFQGIAMSIFAVCYVIFGNKDITVYKNI